MRIAVVGGGAAGFFAAIEAARTNPNAEVTVLERGREFLSKVRISGGGRCNVTHDCHEPRRLVENYPRGGRRLTGLFSRFGPAETIAWFEREGVKLKVESDGRLFPTTDSSATIIDCLVGAASRAGVRLRTLADVRGAQRLESGGFGLHLADIVEPFDRLLLTTGGCKTGGGLAAELGHTVTDPVPSLFTFHLAETPLCQLSGLSVMDAEVASGRDPKPQRGALLITHRGVSGPAILRLSAWGARRFHAENYRFPITINFQPDWGEAEWEGFFGQQRQSNGARLVVNCHPPGIPARLWIALIAIAEVDAAARWCDLRASAARTLRATASALALEVVGKSPNKEEFVTCGGVPLDEIDLKTMESRIHPGLFFAGEILDVDGVTGGFNLQHAWADGWHAGHAISRL